MVPSALYIILFEIRHVDIQESDRLIRTISVSAQLHCRTIVIETSYGGNSPVTSHMLRTQVFNTHKI